MHAEDVKQLARGIADALTRCWEQLSKLIVDKSKLSCVLLSSLTLHNVTIAPSTSDGVPTVRCVLKAPGLYCTQVEDTTAAPALISTRFGRLLYCLLTTSVCDSLPTEAMVESLKLCMKEQILCGRTLPILPSNVSPDQTCRSQKYGIACMRAMMSLIIL